MSRSLANYSLNAAANNYSSFPQADNQPRKVDDYRDYRQPPGPPLPPHPQQHELRYLHNVKYRYIGEMVPLDGAHLTLLFCC